MLPHKLRISAQTYSEAVLVSPQATPRSHADPNETRRHLGRCITRLGVPPQARRIHMHNTPLRSLLCPTCHYRCLIAREPSTCRVDTAAVLAQKIGLIYNWICYEQIPYSHRVVLTGE